MLGRDCDLLQDTIGVGIKIRKEKGRAETRRKRGIHEERREKTLNSHAEKGIFPPFSLALYMPLFCGWS